MCKYYVLIIEHLELTFSQCVIKLSLNLFLGAAMFALGFGYAPFVNNFRDLCSFKAGNIIKQTCYIKYFRLFGLIE